VLWRTPSEDIGFWYYNLYTSRQELENLRPDATQLEKSNVLMKLRETLLDQTGGSTHVTVPAGISIYPHNVLFSWWGWSSTILMFIFGGFLLFHFFADW
jgi:hypothetical protein